MHLPDFRNRSPRLWVAAAFAFFLGLVAVLSISTVMPSTSAAQSVEGLDASGDAANAAWWGALVTGTVEALDAVLAPEFQIMRADGSSYDKPDYLASTLPKVAAMPEITDMVVTAHGDHLVVRYQVTVNETRDGATLVAHAPRLTVYRKKNDKWLVVAHANFATLEQ